MDFARPLQVVSPTLDGDVLTVLARAEEAFSGRRLHRLVGRGSEAGIRKAVERLVDQGIVLRSQAGRAKLYRLNRRHLCAGAIEHLVAAPSALILDLRDEIELWEVRPKYAVLFGSTARRDGGPQSDLDLLIVRPNEVEADSPTWLRQLGWLEDAATAWTGNDARIVELAEDELADGGPLLEGVLRDGVELFGSLRSMRAVVGGDRK